MIGGADTSSINQQRAYLEETLTDDVNFISVVYKVTSGTGHYAARSLEVRPRVIGP